MDNPYCSCELTPGDCGKALGILLQGTVTIWCGPQIAHHTRTIPPPNMDCKYGLRSNTVALVASEGG